MHLFTVRRDWSSKWLIIPGILAAIALAYLVRAGQKAPAPKTMAEPSITVYFHKTGEVKTMPLETYLEGVVAAEMDPNWPLAALEAQAIVARTFTLKKTQEGRIPSRGTEASTDPKEFQAYDETRVNDKVKQAVRNTRGQVITYQGKPINAWFHASSGGKTATPDEGLGFKKESAPYAASVADVQQEPAHTWAARFSTDEVLRAVRSQGIELGSIASIQIGRKGPSGRAETLRINGKEVSAPSLRLALGSEKMRSTLLDEVRLKGSTVYMKGRGYGHGVGMSQWGAWLLAQRGKNALDIVNYYFKNVRVDKMW